MVTGAKTSFCLSWLPPKLLGLGDWPPLPPASCSASLLIMLLALLPPRAVHHSYTAGQVLGDSCWGQTGNSETTPDSQTRPMAPPIRGAAGVWQ